MPKTKVASPGVPPREAINYFKKKRLRPAFDYRDVWREEHAVSFTVAKMVQVDLLADVQDSLQKALAEGETFESWRKRLTPELQKRGWWGKREMTDPETGEVKDVQLGNPRRLRTIYDANLRTARAAGQWERIQRTKKSLPFLVYELGPSREHRVDHESWAGTILPADHPFWRTHFAPNGWGCKCRIRQVTQATADRLLKTGRYTTDAPKVVWTQWHNKRTGLTEDVPVGIDPGWDTNPGWLRQVGLDRALVTKSLALDKLDDVRPLFHSPVRVNDFKAWVNSKPLPDEMRTVAVLGTAEIAYLQNQGKALAETVVVLEAARIGVGLPTSQWAQLPESVAQADHVLWHAKRRQWIYLIDNGDAFTKIVIDTNHQSGATQRAGWQSKLNRVTSGSRISRQRAESLLNNPDYARIQ